MLLLLSTEKKGILLNVYVDIIIVKNKIKTYRDYFVVIFWSLVEHAIPCIAYVFLMYSVFVVKLKPSIDDD